MKKQIFLFLALALIVAGGAFAQRVGDTVAFGNNTWVAVGEGGKIAYSN